MRIVFINQYFCSNLSYVLTKILSSMDKLLHRLLNL